MYVVHEYIHTYTKHVPLHTFIHMYEYKCTDLHDYVYMYDSMCAYKCKYVGTHADIYINIFMQVCLCV